MSLLRIFLFAGVTLANTIVSDALAADPVAATGATRVSFAAEQATRARFAAGQSARAGAVLQPKELVANSYRAYPASCLSYPLPAAPSGPIFSNTVTLHAYNSFDPSGTTYAEDVTIMVWRVACGNTSANITDASLPAYNPYNNVAGPVSVTLMRIQRNADKDHNGDYYPTFPGVHIAQGSITFDNPNDTDFVRVASEPNTVVTDTQIGAPVIDSTTYVLENYPVSTLGYFYFNNAFTIRFDNFMYSGAVTRQFFTDVTGYSPTSTSYPAAFQPLPISGYMTGSWFDPAHGGEGILSEVLENSDGATRTFVATWYTYDQAGVPFWLIAQGNLNIGDTQVQNMTVQYLTGGGFAGAFTPPLARPIWGLMSVQFIDCNTMKFSYSGSAAAVNGPVANGTQTRTWTRIGNINSLTCE